MCLRRNGAEEWREGSGRRAVSTFSFYYYFLTKGTQICVKLMTDFILFVCLFTSKGHSDLSQKIVYLL